MTSTPKEPKQDKHSTEEDGWMNVVTSTIQNLRYGSVQITVHDGRVTLVESIEKTRFTSSQPSSSKDR